MCEVIALAALLLMTLAVLVGCFDEISERSVWACAKYCVHTRSGKIERVRVHLAAGLWPLASGRWPLHGRRPLATGHWRLTSCLLPPASGFLSLAFVLWRLGSSAWQLASCARCLTPGVLHHVSGIECLAPGVSRLVLIFCGLCFMAYRVGPRVEVPAIDLVPHVPRLSGQTAGN